jgi:hypothetical protein
VNRRGSRAILLAAVLVVSGACVEAYVSRTARLVGHVATGDGRTGVPCTAVALLFDEEDARATVPSGSAFQLTVSMLSPAKVPGPMKAAIAVRVTCDGYAAATTEVREAEVAVQDPPTLDFGTITLAKGE